MRFIKTLFILFALLLNVQLLKAQGTSQFQVNYTPSLPLGDVADYTGNFSFRGINIAYEYHITEYLGLGITTGINTYYEDIQGVENVKVDIDGKMVTLSGKRYNYTNSVPILATANYYFSPEGQLRPYVGLGIGGYYVMKWTEIGQYQVRDNGFQFGLAPRVGVLKPLAYGLGLHLAAQYNAGFGEDPFSSVDFMVGFSWQF
ncbi:OmpW family protein [Echinicola soli]|uniref:OmpW family protein n=1 Tax=Echinicola soli TaxID=2591634 RepID=A0A514CL20_9BACT|nr:OmpW family outer membrane protein [Echinicola soli]QDH80488.1 OmpW family protein [Echinicola soli]